MKILRSHGIRLRILLCVAIPLACLLALGSLNAYYQYRDWRDSARLAAFGEVTETLIQLGAALQSEGEWYVGDYEAGARYDTTDDAIEILSRQVPGSYNYFGLDAEFSRLVGLLSDLDHTRQSGRGTTDVLVFYDSLVSQIHRMVELLVVGTSDPATVARIDVLSSLLDYERSLSHQRMLVYRVAQDRSVDRVILESIAAESAVQERALQ